MIIYFSILPLEGENVEIKWVSSHFSNSFSTIIVEKGRKGNFMKTGMAHACNSYTWEGEERPSKVQGFNTMHGSVESYLKGKGDEIYLPKFRKTSI